MNISSAPLTPCLTFKDSASQAANFYVSIFPHSSIQTTQHYPAGLATHVGRTPGSVLSVSFTLNGTPFLALNGPVPENGISNRASFIVNCETQQEIDHYWEKLGEGADEATMMCGWLTDRFGVTWQVVPRQMDKWVGSAEEKVKERVMLRMGGMKKLILEDLRKAYEGEE